MKMKKFRISINLWAETNSEERFDVINKTFVL